MPLTTSQTGLAVQASDLLSAILKISSEGIIQTGVSGEILTFSSGAEAMFGYRAEEVVGKALELLLPEAVRPRHAGHLAVFGDSQIGATVMRERGGGLQGRRKTGEVFPIEASISKLETNNGLVLTAIVRDLTEQLATEAALATALEAATAASSAKSAFLATMSHEIRTPLNGVLGMAQVMAGAELPQLQRERLDIIRQSGEALLAILNDILDLSKIEAGKLELNPEPFDLATLVRGAQSAFTALANRQGLSFALDIKGAEGVYVGDASRIRQILYNLISNALKFTEVGEIRVTASRSRSGLQLAIRDTGIGIDAAALTQLFDPFVQADASTTRRYGGTGLGLAICRNLARLMGGDLSVESRKGEGSVFTVDLPLQLATGSPAGERTLDDASHRFGQPSLRILAAEDNPTNQLVLKAILHHAGISPLIVSDGREALAAMAAESFDLVLMDIQMPNMNGPDAAREIRRRQRDAGSKRTPIIALTANALAHQQQSYLEAGMDAVVTKPIDVTELFEKMSLVLHAEPHL